MKKLTAFLILLGGLTAVATSTLQAQQKIGFYDSEEILSAIPEYSGVQQQLTLLSSQWKEEIRELETEIESLEEDFEAKEVLYTDEIREERLAEINRKKQQKEQLIAQKFGPDGEYFTRQRELLEPIQRQVFTAVRAIARRQDFDYIFDRSGDVYMVYANEEFNLNEDIMQELGIDTEDN
ncbi:OmpH family outer membrane protein [Gracilimonas mengyeensis]|uniref:Periplasmic chaperone for outer membrane proteins Skp n=1 Tax=Gracilimonas mengyeensis TaxID=1302730 RepID=A0A521EQQ4_9BACT|nr:OmpH family outer membrane protein [Gracilimonas mengyeensis]SMO86269.1 periplasmic chaperone for outer membrane proteins Skp [Gracilimonas mengyeensis]